jgi:hypothetical protein
MHCNFVHGCVSMTYRSSSNMVAIDQYFGIVMPLELRHFKTFYSFPDFFRNVYSYCIGTLYMALYQ